jgi:hypothetical protein
VGERRIPETMSNNVFVDFHHAGLLDSLIMLFEGRLGGNLYRPIGRDWYNNGFWKVYEHPATVAQYLDPGGATPDNTPKLNEIVKTTGEVYQCQDIDSGYFNKAITYTGFINTHFDIVIATIPQHIEPFFRLCQLHPDKPKLIYQIGNAWPYELSKGLVNNIMASARIDWGTGREFYPSINIIEYHQEFNVEVFKPDFDKLDWVTTDYPANNIYSFVNVFNAASHFTNDWELFLKVEKLLANWNFKSYGGQCRDGSKNGAKQVAEAMLEARFIWHTKSGGDGYGHIVHNAPAVGRPLIIKKEYYTGKMAEPLLEDGVTCITIDDLTPEQIIEKINYYSDPYRYEVLCKNAYERFKTVVNFDNEERAIREFLQKLV